MRVGRRVSLAICASVGTHVVAGAVIVGSSLLDSWPSVPIDVEITGMRLEDLQDLPLGLPASGVHPADAPIAALPSAPPHARPPRPDRQPRAPKAERTPGPRIGETDDKASAPAPRPSSVRSYAPEGSRVTALLRLDRLRGSSYAPVVDALLMHLPDRRDLLEGTGIDLYRDLDALLVATPNPLDAAVTFLVARHRLSDRALRAALERGARATGRKLDWMTERGRPFAERRPATVDAPGARDQRLILLAAPSLVVVAPPVYRSLILRAGAVRRAAVARPTDGGAPSDRGGTPDGAAGPHGDAGNRDGGAAPSDDDGTGWAVLLRRIDAEDSVLPPDAVAMVSAVDLFATRPVPAGGMGVASGTRGTVDDVPSPQATVFAMPVPRVLTATLGIAPQPFADIDAEFSIDADALAWDQEWPSLRSKLLTNPLVVLSGFSGLIGRVTITRSGTSVHVHVDATELETTRILQFASAQLSAMGR